jgi:glycosyltransferase involved in cell wall biosynthesis
MKKPQCILVTGSLQPYAVDFYRALDRSLRCQGWNFLVLVGSRTTYRPWAGMGIDENDPLFAFVSGKPAPEWIQRVLGSSSRDKILLPGGSGIGRALSAKSPDILIVNERNPLSLSAALWAKRRGVPCLLSTDIGSSPPPYAATKCHLIYHRLLGSLFSGVIAKTKDGETAPTRSGAAVPILAPHGIDTARYPLATDAKSQPFRFLFVGVLEERKGLDTLMAAARLLATQGHRFEIRLVGSGSWSPSAEDAQSNWLSMAGFREGEALLEEYHAASAFVLPTREDTYAVVVHEAASCGLPLLISTGAGACHVLVEDGVSGFAFNPGEAAALSTKMTAVLSNEELRTKLENGARTKALQWCAGESGVRVANWLLNLKKLYDH